MWRAVQVLWTQVDQGKNDLHRDRERRKWTKYEGKQTSGEPRWGVYIQELFVLILEHVCWFYFQIKQNSKNNFNGETHYILLEEISRHQKDAMFKAKDLVQGGYDTSTTCKLTDLIPGTPGVVPEDCLDWGPSPPKNPHFKKKRRKTSLGSKRLELSTYLARAQAPCMFPWALPGATSEHCWCGLQNKINNLVVLFQILYGKYHSQENWKKQWWLILGLK